MSHTRGYCFTLNNYTELDIEKLRTLDVDYLIFGREVGDEGTPHLQGFLYKKTKIRFKKIKRMLGKRYHIEAQKGSIAQAIEYCMKDEDYEEIGDRPRQGKRTDLDLIKHDLKKNITEQQIANKYFSQWCQYRRAFREYRDLITQKNTLIVIYDPLSINSCKKLTQYCRGQYIKIDFYQDLLYTYYSQKYDYIHIQQTDSIISLLEDNPLDIEKNNINYIIV